MQTIYIVQFASKPCVRMRKVISSFEKSGFKVCYCGINREDNDLISRPYVKHFGLSTKRGSILKIFSLPFYIINVVYFLFKVKAVNVYSADLEGGLCGSIYSKLTSLPVRFFYDVLDTYSERYKSFNFINTLINKVESQVALSSTVLIHVDNNRVNTLKTKDKDYFIVRNVPSKESLHPIVPSNLDKTSDRIKVLISGGIYEHRGVGQLLKLMSNDTGFSQSIELTVIGFGDKKIIDEMTELKNCNYLGYVNSSDAQKLSAHADIILSLYDPSKEINRLACPNKVYDGAANGVYVLVNSDILEKSSFSNYPNVIECDYFDLDSIKAAISSISSRETNHIYEFAFHFRNTLLWENEFKKVIDHIRK